MQTVKATPQPRRKALTPLVGVTERWLDNMILAGRMCIGEEPCHRAICQRIRDERSALPPHQAEFRF